MTALVWGVKASLLEYLADLGDATTTCSDGAGTLPDGRFRWPAAATDDGFDGSGTVRFEAYDGMLDVRLAAPRLDVSGGGARLFVGVSEIATGTAADDSGSVRVTLAVTEAGSRLLGDVYPPGTALDDLVVER